MTTPKYSTPEPRRDPGYVQADGRRTNSIIVKHGDLNWSILQFADSIARLVNEVRTCKTTPSGDYDVKELGQRASTLRDGVHASCGSVILDWMHANVPQKATKYKLPNGKTARGMARSFVIDGEPANLPASVWARIQQAPKAITDADIQSKIIPASAIARLERMARELEPAIVAAGFTMPVIEQAPIEETRAVTRDAARKFSTLIVEKNDAVILHEIARLYPVPATYDDLDAKGSGRGTISKSLKKFKSAGVLDAERSKGQAFTPDGHDWYQAIRHSLPKPI